MIATQTNGQPIQGSEIIRAVGVSKAYGATRALDDVTLPVYAGEVLALVGENGAGKSTLGKILAGVTAPTKGEIRMQEVEVRFQRPRDALQAGIAIVHQELALLPSRSVLHNVFLGLETSRFGVVNDGALREQFDALVRTWGFDIDPEIPVRELSTGDQQKVEILRALARDARLIIMDEPTARLTAPEALQFHAMVRRLRERGKAIILISHFLEEVLSLSDRVTIMRDGRVVRSGFAADETPKTLIQGMLGRTIETSFPPRTNTSRGNTPALVVSQLTGRKFRDISLEVHAGEIVGIAGMVGSGRSELLRAIFGADRTKSGQVQFANYDRPGFASPRQAIDAGLVMLPESRKDEGLLLLRSVSENVVLPHLKRLLAPLGVVSRRRQASVARNAITMFNIRCDDERAGVASLSGGNQQKVALAKCLIAEPRVLLQDEPTRGVDVSAKRAIYELIFDFVDKGGAVLVVSSELEEVIGLSDRLLVMKQGRITGSFDRKSASKERVLDAAFGAS